MGVFDEGYDQAVIDAGRQPVERPPAGFLETFLATWQSTRQEDLTISESTNLGRHRQTRREKIKELTGEDISFLEGQALPQIWMGQETDPVKNYRAKIRELSARHPEIRTDEDILGDISEESRRIRERTEKVLGNTTFGGNLGSFAGAMAAATTDYPVIASMGFGASFGATILRTALTEAGIGALSEAMAQPFIWRYKKKLESPYDLGEALTRVAGAGIGSGILASALKGVARGIRRLRKPPAVSLSKPRLEGLDDILEAFDKHVKESGIEPTLTQRDAAHVLGDYADTLRENPFELGDPAADMRHLEATAKAMGDVEAGRPVDVREFVGDLEPRPEVKGRERVIVVKEPKARPVPTENQSLGQFVKNSGGVSVDEAGDLRGEYDALFEGGGRKAGVVKRRTGKSPDEMAQLAHEAGFIEEPDPAILAEALGRDLGGEKVLSIEGERFQRRMDVQIEREWNRWAEGEYEAYLQELETRARGILEAEDVEISVVARAEEGELVPLTGREAAEAVEKGEATIVTRSAKEFIEETESDVKAGEILTKCLLGK